MYLNPIVLLLISDTGDYSIVICILSFSSYKYILRTHYVDRIHVFMPDNLICACIYNWAMNIQEHYNYLYSHYQVTSFSSSAPLFVFDFL